MLNKSPEPTAVGAFSSAVAVRVASRRWLSYVRRHHTTNMIWKILGISISVLSIAWGIELVLFFDLLHQTDPWAMSTTAYISFGLFGFPLTIIPVAIGALMMWFGPSSWSAHDGIIHWVSTIGMVLCYFIQWQYLAYKCFRRSKYAA